MRILDGTHRNVLPTKESLLAVSLYHSEFSLIIEIEVANNNSTHRPTFHECATICMHLTTTSVIRMPSDDTIIAKTWTKDGLTVNLLREQHSGMLRYNSVQGEEFFLKTKMKHTHYLACSVNISSLRDFPPPVALIYIIWKGGGGVSNDAFITKIRLGQGWGTCGLLGP
jgi:hypothetical protein